MTSTRNTIFWALQIFSWNIPALNSWMKLLNPRTLKPSYIIIEGLIILIMGIISSSWLRYYLNKHIDFGKLSTASFKKIGLGYFISSAGYFVLTMIFAYITYNMIQETKLVMNPLMLLSNAMNSFLFMLIWLVFYISIKSIIKLRAAKIKQIEIQSELKGAQLNILKGQINPHFMFNSLNNIRGLILEDKHKAREMITRLSEMLRYSLNKDKIDTIALSQELEMVENYIALSKIQLEKRLKFKQNIDRSLLSILIPPMIIQILIENAIKHGIANQNEGGTVSLTIEKHNQLLSIKVSNTGHLVKDSASTQLGLKNIEKRLKLLYHNQAQFSLKEKSNQVTATITLPINGIKSSEK